MPIGRRDLVVEDSAGYVRLAGALDQLESEYRLRDVNIAGSEDPRRVRLGRTHMALLGYLPTDSGRDRIDAALRDAVRRFQGEAGLPVSGALDDATWTALGALAQFDSDTNLPQWLEGAPSPALERAVRLRLFAYGLLGTPPSHKRLNPSKHAKAQQTFGEALRDFVRIAALLGFRTTPLDPSLNIATLTLLFDHVAMVQGIRQRGESEMLAIAAQHPRFPLERVARQKLSGRFAKSLALVELWLLGYAVRPGLFKPDGKHGRDADGTLNRALNDFAADFEVRRRDGKKRAFGFWFFVAVRALQEGDEDEGPKDVVLNHLLCQPKNLKKLAKAYQAMGARMIDGVRRAIRWVIGMLRQALGTLTQALRNIARVLNHAALAVYQRLKAVVRTMATGFDYLFRPEVKGSDLDVAAIRKRADFDMDVFIDRDAAPERVRRFFDILGTRVRAMDLGAQIFAKLVELAAIVAVAASAAVAWLTLIIALVKLARWLQKMAVLTEQASALIQELDVLDGHSQVEAAGAEPHTV